MKTQLKFLVIMLSLVVIGCSRSNQSNSTSSSGFLPSGFSSQNSDLFSTGSGGATSLTEQSLFDVGTGKDNPFNGSTPTTNSTESYCLANDPFSSGSQGTNLFTGTTSSTSTSQSSCLSSSVGSPQSFMLENALLGYQYMDQCLAIVLQRAPAANASAADIDLAFTTGQLAMVRCYRLVYERMMSIVPWIQQYQSSLGNNDYYFWQSLQYLFNNH